MPAPPSPACTCPVFIKRNRTRHGAKDYESVLLVHGKRVPAKRPRGRPPAGGPPPKTIVVPKGVTH